MGDLTLKELTNEVMQLAKEKKFHTKPNEVNVGEMLALVHSEVSEALEAYRHHNMEGEDGFYEELGDVIIRVVHLCGIFDVDIEKYIVAKMERNQKRSWENDKLLENI
jgi:NTP pyrophosphatase (non-canonical NTP hydrolase)